jgi:hypothetical protein
LHFPIPFFWAFLSFLSAMKLSINLVSTNILFSGLTSAANSRRAPTPRRASSLLLSDYFFYVLDTTYPYSFIHSDPDAFPDLPTAQAATAAADAAGLNLDDIQGDVL